MQPSNIRKNNTFFLVMLIKIRNVDNSKSFLNRLKSTLKRILIFFTQLNFIEKPKMLYRDYFKIKKNDDYIDLAFNVLKKSEKFYDDCHVLMSMYLLILSCYS